ncbi:MAG: GTP-binding protein [Candidatus Thorarchaeota archaeon]|jgi:small GTP-binding protein
MEGVAITTGPLRRQFKICLIGDGFVGKTSIRRTFMGKVFKRSYIATLGVDFAQKTIVLKKIPVYLIIWDIAGQPLFQGLRRRYYEGCSGLVLAYSVVDRLSFDNASKWLVEAHGFMGKLPPLIIVGNKIDLRPSHSEAETVSYNEGQAFTKRFGEELNAPSIFIETSALTGENINDAFERLTKLMIDKTDGRLIDTTRSIPSQLREDRPTPIAEEVASASSISDDVARSEAVSPFAPIRSEGDETAASVPDSVVHEEPAQQASTEVLNLRAELKRAESELSKITSDLDTALLNLKNTVHVKRIMHEHLKRQLRQTRQEWSDAYEEYVKTDQRKKAELEKKTKQIEDLQARIRRAEESQTD